MVLRIRVPSLGTPAGGGTAQHLAAGATAVSTGTAALDAQHHLAADAAAVSTGTAALAGPITVAARWNPSDASGNAVITNGGLTLGGTTNSSMARSAQFESTGQKYVEFVIGGTDAREWLGFANASETLGNFPGFTTNSIGYNTAGGLLKSNNTTLATAATSTLGDTIAFYIDFSMGTNGTLWLYKNNVQSGTTGVPGVSGGVALPAGPLALYGDPQILNAGLLNINATTTYTPQPGFTGFGNGVAINQHLAATAAVVATGTAETRVKYHLAATAASVATATADVRRSYHIIASAAALSTATANLDVQAGGTDHLAANATSVKTATAALRVTHHLAAGATVTCSVSAFLIAGAIDIFANARVAASGSGTLSKFWTDISDAPEIWTDIR